MFDTSSPPQPEPPPDQNTNRDTDRFATFAAVEADGLSYLRHLYDAGATVETLLSQGLPKSVAISRVNAAETFFAKWQKTKAMRAVHETLQHNKLHLYALLAIDAQLRKLKKAPQDTRIRPYTVLADIVEAIQPDSLTDTIAQLATRIVRQNNRRIDQAAAEEAKAQGQKPKPTHGKMYGGNTTDAEGLSWFHLGQTPHQAARTRASIYKQARRKMREDNSLSLSEAMAMVGAARLSREETDTALPASAADAASTAPPLVPFVVISEERYHQLSAGIGGPEEYGLPDGTVVTGDDIVTRGLSKQQYFGVFTRRGEVKEVLRTRPDRAESTDPKDLMATLEPMPGKLNAGRTQRSANPKQRMAIEAMTLVCQWPGCTTPAVECDVHHLKSWNSGGPTDIDNLWALCKVHNGRHDDDEPGANGRISVEDGTTYYQPPQTGETPVEKQKYVSPMDEFTAASIAKKQTTARPDDDGPVPPETAPDQDESEPDEPKPEEP